jgi:hypothetical protein
MKYLSDYTNQAQTELFEQCNAFFAFSNEQFAEQKKEGIKYASLGAGLICDKSKVKILVDGLETIQAAGIAKDIEENGIFNIIKRELSNYESYYTGDISDAESALKPYGVSHDQILEVFYREYPKQDL